jgi:glycosyltransferase involved in cell wall biosynthesis
MATYNGAPYLSAQLESVAAQTRLPDELVVCDDGSTDATVPIAEAFARQAPFAVRVERNPRRLGAHQNFARAMSLCAGQAIAFADQDDIWLPARLERLLAAMEQRGAAFAFCDARLIGEDGRAIGGRTLLDRRFPLDAIARAFSPGGRPLPLMLKRDFIYGTTLVFDASLREALLPIPDGWSHDTWVVNMLVLLGERGVAVLEPLVLYRQHGVQASGGMSAPKRVPYATQLAAYEALRERARAVAPALARNVDPDDLRRLDEKIRYLRALVEIERLPLPRRAAPIAREVLSGRWRRYSPRVFRIRPRWRLGS